MKIPNQLVGLQGWFQYCLKERKDSKTSIRMGKSGLPLRFSPHVIFAVGFLSLLFTVSALTPLFAQAAHPVLNLHDFGAVGDGKADDTNAVQKWLAALTPGTRGYAPAGVYVIQSPLKSTTPRISIVGDGPYQTVFAYAGTDTNADIFTIQDVVNWHISGLRITAFTKMSGGVSLHLKNFCRSMIDQVVIDGQDGNNNLWNGIWFDAVDMVTYRNFDIVAQNDAVMVNGGLGSQPKADLMLQQGKIGGSQVGLLVGGAFGGLCVDQIDIIANGRNVVIDNSLAHEGNRELFFGPTAMIDSAKTGASITLADTLASSASWLEFSGTWIASGITDGFSIAPDVNWTVQFTGGNIFNFDRDGIHNESKNIHLICNGTIIRNNRGYGVQSLVPNDAISLNATYFSNSAGDYAHPH